MVMLSPCQCFRAPAFSRRNQFRLRPTGLTNGTLTFHPDGTFTYTPNTHYVGTDSFTYTWSDGIATSEPATVSINVYNNAPVAYDASFNVLHDQTLNAAVSGYDPDGDAITAQVANGPSHGTLTLNADGSFTYTAAWHYVGPDSFTYHWSDGVALSNAINVFIEVTNNPPVAEDATYSILQGQLLSGTVAGNDADGDVITAALDFGPSHGTVNLQEDGTFTYEPVSGFVGVDSFTYSWSDGLDQGNAARITLVVHDGHSPIAYDAAFSVLHDQELAGRLSGWDPDGDVLTAVLDSSPANGSLVLQPDGRFTYIPSQHYVGSDSFTYHWSDGLNDGPIATVLVEVSNRAPISSGVCLGLTETGSVEGQLYGYDPDGDAVWPLIFEPPAHGTVLLQSDGSFRYEAGPEFSGTDSFSFRYTDGTTSGQPAQVCIHSLFLCGEDNSQNVPEIDYSLQLNGLIASLVKQGWKLRKAPKERGPYFRYMVQPYQFVNQLGQFITLRRALFTVFDWQPVPNSAVLVRPGENKSAFIGGIFEREKEITISIEAEVEKVKVFLEFKAKDAQGQIVGESLNVNGEAGKELLVIGLLERVSNRIRTLDAPPPGYLPPPDVVVEQGYTG